MSWVPWITAWLVVAALAASVAPGLAERLQFEPALTVSGEWWRALGCHLVHCSPDHLLWNVLALGALGTACELRGRRGLLVMLLVSAVAVPVALWLVQPGLPSYRGLSGLASGCFTLVAVRIALAPADVRHVRLGALAGASVRGGRRNRWRTAAAWGLLGLFAAKTVYELILGQAVFADGMSAGFVPVPLAHAAAGGVGLAVGWLEAQAPGRVPRLATGGPLPSPSGTSSRPT